MQVTWEQALAWRLQRGFLDPRGTASTGEIVSRLCGVQAQVASAAETAVGIRQAKPKRDGVKRGLTDGSLVKTWAMRGTLHVLPTGEAGAYLSLVAATRFWEKPSWQRAFGATPQQITALTEAVSQILDGRSLTRDELVTRLVADKRFTDMEEQLRSGWGTLLKPLAWQGALCFGANDGSNVTFTSPASAVRGWQEPPEPDEAAPAVISSYLGAYGPSTALLFDNWLSRNNLKKGMLRQWFADMGDQLTEVDVEGQTSYVLTEHADELSRMKASSAVRLLGQFDQYVLGPGTKAIEMLPAKHRSKVSRAGGWISPVVVVGGRIVGVWEQDDQEIVVSMFPEADPPPMDDLEAEAAHVAKACGLGDLNVRLA